MVPTQAGSHRPDAVTPSGLVSRRTLVKGTAWSIPVVAAAIAVPVSTASVTPALDLASWPNGLSGTPSPGNTLESSWLICNNSSTEMPAGAVFNVYYPYPMTDGAALKDNTSGNNGIFQAGPVQGPNTWFDGSTELYWRTQFTLIAAIPAGSCFTLVTAAPVSSNPNWTTGTARNLIAVSETPSGITDSNSGNNWAQQGPLTFTR